MYVKIKSKQIQPSNHDEFAQTVSLKQSGCSNFGDGVILLLMFRMIA